MFLFFRFDEGVVGFFLFLSFVVRCFVALFRLFFRRGDGLTRCDVVDVCVFSWAEKRLQINDTNEMVADSSSFVLPFKMAIMCMPEL